MRALLPSSASACRGIAEYFLFSFIPSIQLLDPYPWGTLTGYLAGFALLGVFAFVLWLLWRHRQNILVQFGLLWLAAAVIPVMGLEVSLVTSFNDRLLYLPAIGASLIVAGLVMISSRQVTLAAALAVALMGIAQTIGVAHWATAAQMVDHYRHWLDGARKQYPAGSDFLVTSVPDSFRGAYILRNALPMMMANDVGDSNRIFALSYFFVNLPDTEPVVEVKCVNSGLLLQSKGPELLPAPQISELFTSAPMGPIDRFGRSPLLLVKLHNSSIILSPPGQRASATCVSSH